MLFKLNEMEVEDSLVTTNYVISSGKTPTFKQLI